MNISIAKYRPLRLALVGASRIAERILPKIRAASSIEVVGVAASNFSRAEIFAWQNQIRCVFSSYEEAFNSSKVDAVYISTLNVDHFSLIVKALMAGKHVLCEKPIVLNYWQAREITKLAFSRKLILMEAMMYRFHPHVDFLMKNIGELGRLKSMNLCVISSTGAT